MAVIISMAAGAININALNRGSVVAIGEVSQTGWSLNGKTNFGDGQMYGANIQTGFVATVFDNDLIDNPNSEIEPATSIQGQAL
ncbi:hypothetical protein J19TS2_59200 [Cohnella xylanilytica]|uniref:Spore germination protein GerPA/GerPF n=1 Tax=Cohnella xylanilytica TaxID=557555 RepID=A0A841U3L9_9BACL|nr:hypothetical protein [Cohnella xylanilytica]MBB6692660.1 hypothetical protein [Cohnella xylanilytica]GIO16365.1 hypothetical protein J19TS2_59200 [Cohnella xylanilytica]